MRYAAYSHYKHCGVDWIGQIPSHWDVKRLRFTCGKIEQGWSPQCDNQPADEDSWGVMKVGCVNGDKFDASENKALPAELAPKPEYELRPKDILISRANTKELLGSAAIVPEDVRARLLLCDKLFRLRLDSGVNEKFLTHYLRTPNARYQYEREANGASGSMQNIGQDTIKNLLVVLPPREEQDIIAKYLDWKTGQIDALITKKRLLLEKLKERRIAVITQAVTKGLNPNVYLRDSGIPWIDQVPRHWEVMKFGYRTHIQEGQVDPECEPYSEMFLIAPNHIESNTGRVFDLTTARDQAAISGKYLVHRGDVVYSKIRPHLNKCTLARFDGLCSADMYPIRSESDLLSAFLVYWMLAQPFHSYATESSMRVAMPKLNRETLSSAPLLVPPLAEQVTIVAHLEVSTRKIDDFLAKVELAIKHMAAYRTALITTATTGKVDLRNLKAEVRSHVD